MSQNLETSPDRSPERDCIIFIPALGSGSVDQSIAGVADRIAMVLRLNAKDEAADFHTKIELATGITECSGEVGTVFRKDGDTDRAIVDIYKFDYRDSLVTRVENRNLFIKALMLLVVLPGTTLRIVGALISGRSAKTRVEIFQLLYALGILSLLVIYVAILVFALWKTMHELVPDFPGPVSLLHGLWTHPPDALKGAIEFLRGISVWFKAYVPSWLNPSKVPQAIVVISAAAALLLPSRFTLKTLIGQAAVTSLSMIYYLNLGEGRASVFGRLELLIDDILKHSEEAKRQGLERSYRNVSILAYSFGSIIALDSFFPTSRKPSRALTRIHSLVTIGCPFDFVRTLWRGYFDSRRGFAPNCPAHWLNVYSPEDVLGSNFRNSPDSGAANITVQGTAQKTSPDAPLPQLNIIYTQGVEYSRLSWLDSFTLLGLRSHGMYWGASPTETNCFNDLVPHMWEGSWVLE